MQNGLDKLIQLRDKDMLERMRAAIEDLIRARKEDVKSIITHTTQQARRSASNLSNRP
jgi:hypothetical protein